MDFGQKNRHDYVTTVVQQHKVNAICMFILISYLLAGWQRCVILFRL